MAESKQKTEETSKEKKPYEPPKILWEEPWVPVTLAISCARLPGQSAGCNAAPGTS